MSTNESRRDKQAGTLRISNNSAVKIDFKLTLNNETNVALLAPVRLNKFGSKFK